MLFCDMVGSTAQADGVDPEDVQATLDVYYQRLRAELERHGATVEKFIGDAVMAVFGAPIAHEDDAERAVRAGLRILDAIAELNEARGLELAVRVGVATGEVLVRPGGGPALGMVVGDVVNTAARLQTAAPPGGLVVGATTYALTRDDIDYLALAPVVVKGKAAPVAVWRAVAPRARMAGEVTAVPTTALVGRLEELAALRGAFGRAVRERSVQLVTVTGEAGVGKSRLVRELFTLIDDAAELVRWRQGRCLPYGDGITFWALGEIVKAEAGIMESDDEATARVKLTAAVDVVMSEDRAWLVACLGPLVGLSAARGEAAGQEESFTAWRRFLEAAAADSPLVVVVEDAHWADPALLAFLDHLVDWAEGVALLVLVTARPELYAAVPTWGGGKRNATTLALKPLADADTAKLLAVLLDVAVLPAQAQAALLERAGGNPLYAEQLIRLLNEQGLLTRRGRVVELAAGAELPLPEEVSALIAARLDTLAAPAKALLADAAVLGRVFWSGGLAAVSGRSDGEVRVALRDLGRAEFVRRLPRSSVAGQDEYAFWHALVRDVAYRSLPRQSRAAKHVAAAAWLEGLAGDRVADHAELLAHHYLTALELRGSREQGGAALAGTAARYLVLAGDRIADLDAQVAAGQYARAVELLGPDDTVRPDILAKWGRTCRLVGQADEAERIYREALTAFESRHDTAGAGYIASELALLFNYRGDTINAAQLVERAITLLEGEPPGEALAHAYEMRAFDHVIAARPSDALSVVAKLMAMGERAGRWQPWALTARGYARLTMGDIGGVEDSRQAVRVARRLGIPSEVAATLANLGEFEWLVEGPHAGLARYREARDICQRCGQLALAASWWSESVRPTFDLGDWDALLARSAELRPQLELHDNNYCLAGMEPYRAAVLVWRGAVAAARTSIGGVLAAARDIADLQTLVPVLAVAALVEQKSGHEAAALDFIGEYEAAVAAKADGVGWHWGWWFLADMVRMCVTSDAVGLAEDLIGDARPAIPRHHLSVLTARACLAEAQGQIDGALSLYAEAARGWQDYGHVLEHGLAMLGIGRCRVLLHLGEADHALIEARRLFAHLHAEPLLADTDRWLSRDEAQTS